MSNVDLIKLKTSWTKYDAVQVIDVITNVDEINKYLRGEKTIDEPSLKNFLGMDKLTDPIPTIWLEIQEFPEQKRLFAMMAAVFTHYENIRLFANEYSIGEMKGVFTMKEGKQFTNLRSALVESGAAPNSLRRKDVVEYDLSTLFEKGEVGILFKKLLEIRLYKSGWDGKNFNQVCLKNEFHKALSITEKEFQRWTSGESLIESTLKYNLRVLSKYKEFKAYKVKQWLNDWNDIDFSEEEMRKRPDPFYLMFKMDARLLKRLSDVHRRKADKSRSEDTAVQRTHSESRSEEIHDYIHGGFPWSTISKSQQESEDYKDLKMPGLLPTAIIANILGPDSERGGTKISLDHQLIIKDLESDFPTVKLPDRVFEEDWNPELKPIEIIDGQHRLWAFDEKEEILGDYELPVIAYFDLDRAWQAYLFYTINIKPVKINTSLGYDLYPLLRTQKWLESSKEGLMFYRENRAQELVEALWSYKESPWKNRIKMLGEGEGNISQAAFIRALTSSFLKKSVEKNSWGMGGLFSDMVKKGTKYQVINWNRSQQAGFLILMWSLIKDELDNLLFDKETLEKEPEWAKSIRLNEENTNDDAHPAFTSKNSFLSRDQGVRGISMFANDIFFVLAKLEEWNLNDLVWDSDVDDKSIKAESIDLSIKQFREHPIYSVLQAFASEIIEIDWRTPSSDFSDDVSKRIIQTQYKGGSGYNAVWKNLIQEFDSTHNSVLKACNSEVSELLKQK